MTAELSRQRPALPSALGIAPIGDHTYRKRGFDPLSLRRSPFWPLSPARGPDRVSPERYMIERQFIAIPGARRVNKTRGCTNVSDLGQ